MTGYKFKDKPTPSRHPSKLVDKFAEAMQGESAAADYYGSLAKELRDIGERDSANTVLAIGRDEQRHFRELSDIRLTLERGAHKSETSVRETTLPRIGKLTEISTPLGRHGGRITSIHG